MELTTRLRATRLCSGQQGFSSSRVASAGYAETHGGDRHGTAARSAQSVAVTEPQSEALEGALPSKTYLFGKCPPSCV